MRVVWVILLCDLSYVRKQLVRLGYEADADLSTRTMNKKVREAQVAAFNYIAVVGEKEQNDLTVTLRKRDTVSWDTLLGIETLLLLWWLLGEAVGYVRHQGDV